MERSWAYSVCWERKGFAEEKISSKQCKSKSISRHKISHSFRLAFSGGSGINRVPVGIAAQSQAPPLPSRAQTRSAFVVIPVLSCSSTMSSLTCAAFSRRVQGSQVEIWFKGRGVNRNTRRDFTGVWANSPRRCQRQAPDPGLADGLVPLYSICLSTYLIVFIGQIKYKLEAAFKACSTQWSRASGRAIARLLPC